MSETPFMPLTISDFIADTIEMDATETGAYIMLLMAQWKWRGQSLPDDMAKLQRIARCTRNWPRVWEAISVHFERDENGWFNVKGREVFTEVRAKSTANSHNGSLGGTAKARKYKATGLANATISPPVSLYQSESEVEQYGGGGAREAVSTDREAILTAIGVDPVSGITGPSARMIGTRADMAEAARWLDLPGMTMPIVLEEITRVMANKRDGPPSSFKFFTKAMQRLSGELTQEALQPTQPARGARNDRQRFDQTIDAVAAGLSSGAIGLGLESRNPFAKRSGGDPQEGEHGPGPVLRSGQ